MGGGPGFYETKSQLPDMPAELSGFRSRLSSGVSTRMFQNLPQYGGQMTTTAPAALNEAYQMIGRGDNAPSVLNTAGSALTELMRGGGNPVDLDPLYQARLKQIQADTGGAIGSALQQTHLTGTRYGTGAQRAATEAATKAMLGFGSEFAGLEAQSRESALNRVLNAASLAPGVGSAITSIPVQAGTALGNLGLGEWAAKAENLKMPYAEYVRTRAENSPYFNAAMGYGTSYPFQGSQPNAAQQGGLISTILGWLL